MKHPVEEVLEADDLGGCRGLLNGVLLVLFLIAVTTALMIF